ncbi:MAG: transcriptional repressor LexA [Nevskia sp.]|nr:transcriptional repressor LexA [Nevskia sp.]
MSDLTQRQSEILEFIRSRLRDTGFPPTREDIAREFGFSSKTGAQDHLVAIARKGYIELVPGNARGIRLLKGGDEVLSHQFELPLIGSIAAGTPLTAATNVESWLRIDPQLFHPRADFLHRVSGHSMKNANILDGDIVGIHAQQDADNGQIVAAVMPHPKTGEDEITLKRYFRRGRRVTLKPENDAPAYRPIEIELAPADGDSQEQSPFRIAGIYAGLIRPRG